MARCVAATSIASVAALLPCTRLPAFPSAIRSSSSLFFHLSRLDLQLRSLSPLRQPFTSRIQANANAATEPGVFWAAPSVTWKSIGLDVEVAGALARAELPRPSLVQAAAVPVILGTGDVVVAAETGSGKTHMYLAPLVQKIYGKRGHFEDLGFGLVLVLCPNALLCNQVVDMAKALRREDGSTLVRVDVITGGQGWPTHLPDVVVATPAALMNNLFGFDANRRRRMAFVRAVRMVVFDEADMLLGGGYVRDVGRLIDLFRLEEKRVSKLRELEASQAGNNGGLSVEFKEPEFRRVWTEAELEAEETDEEEESERDLEGIHDDSGNSLLFDNQPSAAPSNDQINTSMQRRSDWMRSRKQYKRSKQYIFVAATLPQAGKSSPAAVLKQKFPAMTWIHGNLLHRHNPTLEHRWIQVTKDNNLLSLLVDALQDNQYNTRVLVFANSIEGVDAIARVLDRSELKCMRYHRDITAEEKATNLQVFEQDGGILVCTDAAARGLDIRNITHVIQAEFATSAVDFIHRIGRTARAGQPGLVTSLYTDAVLELVNAMRDAVEAALPVEGAFSRKRSLRRKIKKYGSYQELQKVKSALLKQ